MGYVNEGFSWKPSALYLKLEEYAKACREDNLLHAYTIRNTLPREGAQPDVHAAMLYGIDLSGADLTWFIFDNSDMRGANLRGAKCGYASFRYADLRFADLTGVEPLGDEFEGAFLENYKQ